MRMKKIMKMGSELLYVVFTSKLVITNISRFKSFGCCHTLSLSFGIGLKTLQGFIGVCIYKISQSN